MFACYQTQLEQNLYVRYWHTLIIEWIIFNVCLLFQPEELECLNINLRLDAFIIKDSLNLHWTSEAGMVENMESIVEEYKETRQLLVSVQVCQMRESLKLCLFLTPIATTVLYIQGFKASTDNGKPIELLCRTRVFKRWPCMLQYLWIQNISKVIQNNTKTLIGWCKKLF